VKKADKGKGEAFFNKDTKQTHIALGFHSIKRDHPLRYAANVLNVVLGGNMSSRLFDRLREEKALCYDISTGIKKYIDTGAFLVHAGVDNKKLEEATSELIKEIKRIKRELITADELKRAREYQMGQLMLALEETPSRMLWLGDKVVVEGRAPVLSEIKSGINRVTREKVREAANLIFRDSLLSVACVGPVSSPLKKTIRSLCSVED